MLDFRASVSPEVPKFHVPIQENTGRVCDLRSVAAAAADSKCQLIFEQFLLFLPFFILLTIMPAFTIEYFG